MVAARNTCIDEFAASHRCRSHDPRAAAETARSKGSRFERALDSSRAAGLKHHLIGRINRDLFEGAQLPLTDFGSFGDDPHRFAIAHLCGFDEQTRHHGCGAS